MNASYALTVNTWGEEMAHIIVAIVLATRGQRVAHKTEACVGGNASELKVELLAGDVLIGIHV